MNLTALTADEQMTLLGLVKQMIAADSNVSKAELAYVETLANRIGPPGYFDDIVRGATDALPNKGDVLRAAARIRGSDERATIYAELRRAALCDGIAGEEQQMLTWLAELWELDVAKLDAAIDRYLDDEADTAEIRNLF